MATIKNIALITISALLLLSCGGVGKLKPAPAVYDFGLSQTPIMSDVAVLNIKASDALATNRIRYRLNYQNPAQVFYYAESVWSATPASLLTQKLNNVQITAQPLCGLSIEISAFDHVFTNEKSSNGIVILKAQILATKTRTILANQTFEGKEVVASNDAQGGVAAISKASENALQATLNWASTNIKSNASCR